MGNWHVLSLATVTKTCMRRETQVGWGPSPSKEKTRGFCPRPFFGGWGGSTRKQCGGRQASHALRNLKLQKTWMRCHYWSKSSVMSVFIVVCQNRGHVPSTGMPYHRKFCCIVLCLSVGWLQLMPNVIVLYIFRILRFCAGLCNIFVHLLVERFIQSAFRLSSAHLQKDERKEVFVMTRGSIAFHCISLCFV